MLKSTPRATKTANVTLESKFRPREKAREKPNKNPLNKADRVAAEIFLLEVNEALGGKGFEPKGFNRDCRLRARVDLILFLEVFVITLSLPPSRVMFCLII